MACWNILGKVTSIIESCPTGFIAVKNRSHKFPKLLGVLMAMNYELSAMSFFSETFIL